MPITAKQREDRRNHLGSSDMAAIMGLSLYKSPMDVWLEKVYDTEPAEETKAMRIGNRFEAGLLEEGAERVRADEPEIMKRFPGLKFQSNQFRVKDIFGAHLDAQGYEQKNGKKIFVPIGQEAKTTSKWEGWGDEGTDQVPDDVALQVHHQIYAASLEIVFIPVLTVSFGRLDMRLYKIERRPGIEEKIIHFGQHWWEQHVIAKKPPVDSGPASLDVLKRIRREPETVVDIPAIDVDLWQELREKRLEAGKKEKEALARALGLIGNNEAGRLPDGRMLVFRPELAADKIDRAILRSQWPEIYSKIATKTTRRVPRLRKA